MTNVAEVKVSRINNQIYVLVDNLTPLHMTEGALKRLHRVFAAQVRGRSPEKCRVTVEGEYRMNTDQQLRLCLVVPPPTTARTVQEVALLLQDFSERFWKPYQQKLKTAQVA